MRIAEPDPYQPLAGRHRVPPARHRIAVVVLQGTVALDLAVAVYAFSRRPAVFQKIRAEAESPYDLVICGSDAAKPVALGFDPEGLYPIERIATADTVIVPGLDDPLLAHDPRILDAIRTAARRGARLISLCGGAFVLAQAGVLAGHRVTTHWGLADEFRELFPDVE